MSETMHTQPALSWMQSWKTGFSMITSSYFVLLFRTCQKPHDPFPPGVHALAPGELRELFKDFEIIIYREVNDYGDWGGPPTPHVRMVARKSEPIQ